MVSRSFDKRILYAHAVLGLGKVVPRFASGAYNQSGRKNEAIRHTYTTHKHNHHHQSRPCASLSKHIRHQHSNKLGQTQQVAIVSTIHLHKSSCALVEYLPYTSMYKPHHGNEYAHPFSGALFGIYYTSVCAMWVCWECVFVFGYACVMCVFVDQHIMWIMLNVRQFG